MAAQEAGTAMIVNAEQACQMAGEAIARGEVFIAYPMGERGFSVFNAQVEGSQYVPEHLTIKAYRGATLVAVEPQFTPEQEG